MEPIRIFISYAHKNDIWLRESVRDRAGTLEQNPRDLLTYWKNGLQFECEAEFWYDREKDEGLRGGDPWEKRIFEEIDRADLGVLLITQEFVQSGFIRRKELPRMVDRAEQGKMELVPVLVEPAEWEDLQLASFQLTPGHPTPLLQFLSEHEQHFKTAMLDVLRSLKAKVRRVRQRRDGALKVPPPKLPAVPGSDIAPQVSSAIVAGKSAGSPQAFQEKPGGTEAAVPAPVPPPATFLPQEVQPPPEEERPTAPAPDPAPAVQAHPIEQGAVLAMPLAEQTPAAGNTSAAETSAVAHQSTPRLGTVRLAGASGGAGTVFALEVFEGHPRIGAVRLLQSGASPGIQSSSALPSTTLPRLGQIRLDQNREAGAGESRQGFSLTQPRPAIGAISIRRREP